MSAAGMSFTTVFQNLTAAKFSDSRRLAESKPLENQVPLVAGRTASFLIYIKYVQDVDLFRTGFSAHLSFCDEFSNSVRL